MLSKKIESALNAQVALEHESSQFYLAMASWAEVQGYHGITKFLYHQSDEERSHMLKLFHYINDKGGHAQVPYGVKPPRTFQTVHTIFEHILKHEVKVTSEINSLVDSCQAEKDFTTQNFLQWYVAAQIEEEKAARTLLDKLLLIGNDKGGMYLFDRDLGYLMIVNPKHHHAHNQQHEFV